MDEYISRDAAIAWFREFFMNDWGMAGAAVIGLQSLPAINTAPAAHEIDALCVERDVLRARCDAAERDLAVERGCLSCGFFDECPKDCKNGSAWTWRGPVAVDDEQSASGDASVGGSVGDPKLSPTNRPAL